MWWRKPHKVRELLLSLDCRSTTQMKVDLRLTELGWWGMDFATHSHFGHWKTFPGSSVTSLKECSCQQVNLSAPPGSRRHFKWRAPVLCLALELKPAIPNSDEQFHRACRTLDGKSSGSAVGQRCYNLEVWNSDLLQPLLIGWWWPLPIADQRLDPGFSWIPAVKSGVETNSWS